MQLILHRAVIIYYKKLFNVKFSLHCSRRRNKVYMVQQSLPCCLSKQWWTTWYSKVSYRQKVSNDEQHGTTKYLLVTALQLPAHNFTKFLIYCIRASSNNILPLNIVAFLWIQTWYIDADQTSLQREDLNPLFRRLVKGNYLNPLLPFLLFLEFYLSRNSLYHQGRYFISL